MYTRVIFVGTKEKVVIRFSKTYCAHAFLYCCIMIIRIKCSHISKLNNANDAQTVLMA